MKNNFLENNYKWINWVTVIDSWKKWKNMWIFAVTHWNEPVWIEIFKYLLEDFNLKNKILWWKIFLISVNIKWYKRYLESWEKNSFRFIDDNMNRISNQKFKKNSYEFWRFKELKNIFNEIDFAIDLHSVSKWDDLIWITDEKFLQNWKNFFDTDTILVDKIWDTWALIWEFIRTWKESYWLECWNHLWNQSFKNGKKNILNFLIYKKFICWKINLRKNINIFSFIEEIIPKSKNFKFFQNYRWFTEIKKWEKYWVDWNFDYLNNYWDNIFLWMASKKINYPDWCGFLFKKIF